MTPYRQNLLSCYFEMLTSGYILFQGACSTQMRFEMHEMKEYLDNGYQFTRDMIENSDDPVVQKMNELICETDILIQEMEERNQLSDEDLQEDDFNGFNSDEEDKAVKVSGYIGLVIFMLRIRSSERIEKALASLCEIKNELRPADFRTAWEYKDENIQSIVNFYVKLSLLLDYLETETHSITGKKNW